MNRRKVSMVQSRRRIKRYPRNCLTHAIFAIVTAGKQAECTVSQLNLTKERSIRIQAIYGSVNMLEGTSGLFEAVLYNQGQTQIATTGVVTITSGNKTRFVIRPPTKSDMWIDAGNAASTTLKIAHFDFPCVSQKMSSFSLAVNIRVKFILGKELISDTCPNVANSSRMSSWNRACCSLSAELSDARLTNHEYKDNADSFHMC